jgi:hypothetical protein
MWVVYPNMDKQTVEWSVENERNGMTKVRAGELRHFWISNARRAFSCCGQPNYDERPDYDRLDDINTSTAIKCSTATPCDD